LDKPIDEIEIRDRYRKAGDIVKDLPEAVQAVAFQRVLDELGGTQRALSHSGPQHSKNVRAKKAGAAVSGKPLDRAETLEQNLDRTKYPQIKSSLSTLDRSLYLLKAAKDELDIDGLTPGEIATVLTNKFRVRTPDSTVRMALGDSPFVDKRREGRGYLYRIMDTGEDRLSAMDGESGKVTALPRKGKSSSKKSASRGSKSQPSSKKTRASGGRPGPKKMLEDLIQEGFFASPQTIRTTIEYVRDHKGHVYGAADFGVSLARLLRAGQLTRSRNTENQYEYTTS
jgi:hypothetical protein